MTNKKKLLHIFLYANIFLLCACGVKPPYVDPPQGVKHDTFPHAYPDPRTEPQPGLEKKNY